MKEITLENFRAWGKIGGLAAAKRMSKKQRQERARKAGSAKRKNGRK